MELSRALSYIVPHAHLRKHACRGFLYNTDHLTIVTDRRSAKVSELAANPNVELCWYFPSSREQYRLSGTLDIVSEDHADKQLQQARQEAWARMSDGGMHRSVPQPLLLAWCMQ